MKTKSVKKIEDIPYCGSIYIEGYWVHDRLQIESWSGTTNPLNECENPDYFRAKWTQSIKSKGAEYKEF